MLNELVVKDGDKLYVGHVWTTPSQPLAARDPALQWRFACRGLVVAEFPATTLDTAEAVRGRLLAIVARIEGLREH